MEDLAVTPEYLEELERMLLAAADQAEQAQAETVHVPVEVETTWGPLFREVNDPFIHAEHARHKLVGRIKTQLHALAKFVHSAGAAYASTDALSAENLDKQIA